MGLERQQSGIDTTILRSSETGESNVVRAKILALATALAAALVACSAPDNSQSAKSEPSIAAEPSQNSPEAVKSAPRLKLSLADNSFGLLLYNLPEKQLKFTVYPANNPQDKVEVLSSGAKGNEGLHGVFAKEPTPAKTKALLYDSTTGQPQEQLVEAVYVVEATDPETGKLIPITDPGLNDGIEGDAVFY